MSTTAKKYLDKNFKNYLWTQFLTEIKDIKNDVELNNFLDKYFTTEEIIILEKRLGIIHFLKNGLSYRNIGKELSVTLKTISFVKRKFKKPTRRVVKNNYKSEELLNIESSRRKKPQPFFKKRYKGAQSII